MSEDKYAWDIADIELHGLPKEITKKKQIKILKDDDKHVTAPSTDVNDNAFIVKRKKQV